MKIDWAWAGRRGYAGSHLTKAEMEVSKSGLGLGLVLSCLGPGVDGAGSAGWIRGQDSTVRTDSGGKDDENKAVAGSGQRG